MWRRQPPHVRLPGHTGPIRAVATASLGGVPVAAITGGDDGVIRVWDLLGGVLARRIPTRQGGILGLAVGRLRDGRTVVVSTGSDRTARVWDLLTGAPIGPGFSNRLPMHAVAVRDPRPGHRPGSPGRHRGRKRDALRLGPAEREGGQARTRASRAAARPGGHSPGHRGRASPAGRFHAPGLGAYRRPHHRVRHRLNGRLPRVQPAPDPGGPGACGHGAPRASLGAVGR